MTVLSFCLLSTTLKWAWSFWLKKDKNNCQCNLPIIALFPNNACSKTISSCDPNRKIRKPSLLLVFLKEGRPGLQRAERIVLFNSHVILTGFKKKKSISKLESTSLRSCRFKNVFNVVMSPLWNSNKPILIELTYSISCTGWSVYCYQTFLIMLLIDVLYIQVQLYLNIIYIFFLVLFEKQILVKLTHPLLRTLYLKDTLYNTNVNAV